MHRTARYAISASLCAIVSILILCTGANAASGHTFFVSPAGDDTAQGTDIDQPFRTLERARDAIRELKQGGDLDAPVTVYLRGGHYALTQPLVLKPVDSGTADCPVLYRAYENEQPVITGGRKIAGWKKNRDNVWTTDVPAVKAGQWSFRQLYVNGRQYRRARIPNEGFLHVAACPEGTPKTTNYHKDCQSFEFKPGDLDPTWTNIEDVEVIVYHFWTDSHLPIQSIDTDKNLVTFKHKAGKVFTDDFTENGARYIVENVFEGLDEPGEWYLNRKTGVLYVIPRPGDDLESAEVVAPFAPAFIRFEGEPVQRRYVEHVGFDGLSFEYTNWHLPPGNSNDRQGSASVPAAITLTGAGQCGFDRCRIANIGTFAFEIGQGCSDNHFTYNEISHIAAGGFRINGGTEKDHPLDRTGDNVITDNVLQYYGEDYPSAVGVLLMNTSGNLIAHNAIHHGWYTGVSIGWVWGYQRSISRDNVVEFNHIHHIGQGLLSDMGAIYTLGISPGTVLRNNLIHDVEANRYGGWGIYNDEGSTHLLIEDNVVYNTKFAGYDIHYCKEVTVRNNIFAFGRFQQLCRGRVEPHKSVFFENNIVYWKEGKLLDGNWKDKPYRFYFHPDSERGTRETTSTFDMDWNVYYNPTLSLDKVEFNGMTWDKWHEAGKDTHSVYADPLFVDPDHYDFRLRPESPALEMGFEPIDVTTVGPRDPARSKS